MKFWNFFKSAEAMEVVAHVSVVDTDTSGDIAVEFTEPERLLPQARLRMDKAAAAALASALLALSSSGCTSVRSVCDESRVDFQYTHVSHPFAGWPFGPEDEEDAVHTIGPVARCTVGRGYVDLGAGRKITESGFYGPNLTGTVNIGVNLWSSR